MRALKWVWDLVVSGIRNAMIFLLCCATVTAMYIGFNQYRDPVNSWLNGVMVEYGLKSAAPEPEAPKPRLAPATGQPVIKQTSASKPQDVFPFDWPVNRMPDSFSYPLRL